MKVEKKRKKIFGLISLSILLTTIIGFSVIFNTVDFSNTADSIVFTATLTTEQTRAVQARLQYLGYFNTDVTGYYGPITRTAVANYQQANGRTPTGEADGWVLRMLGVASTTTTTNSDLYLLAKCVYAEARGESYTGQVAIAAVVLNRVKSASFPNTISGVIYQPWAFTAVDDGQINLTPNQTAINAARDAMNGWDPTYGSLFYFNPATATSSWIWSRPYVITIGSHRFCM